MIASKPRILDTKILSDNHYTLKKVSFELQNEDGEWIKQARESYDMGNGAAVLHYDPTRKTVLLARQFRLPTYLNGNEDGYLLEACAGKLDGDTPEACVRRESEEETGYRLKTVEKVFELYTSPGAVTEILHLFLAEYHPDQKVSEGGGVATETEEIEVEEIPFDRVMAMMKEGQIRDAKTLILLQCLALSGRMA